MLKNWGSRIFGKKSHFGVNAQKYPQNRVFWILQKNKSINLTIGGINSIFFHAGTYLLKLQIDSVFLGGRGQAWPGMPKEAIKT